MPIYKCPMCHKIHPNRTKVAECCNEVPKTPYPPEPKQPIPGVYDPKAVKPFPKPQEEESSKGPYPILSPEDEEILDAEDEEDEDYEGNYL